jgi:hypothetical protein
LILLYKGFHYLACWATLLRALWPSRRDCCIKLVLYLSSHTASAYGTPRVQKSSCFEDSGQGAAYCSSLDYRVASHAPPPLLTPRMELPSGHNFLTIPSPLSSDGERLERFGTGPPAGSVPLGLNIYNCAALLSGVSLELT